MRAVTSRISVCPQGVGVHSNDALTGAALHGGMRGATQYSVLRYLDEDMDPRKEFVLTTKEEGLVLPAVVMVVSSVVPDLAPPPSPPFAPFQTIGAGFRVLVRRTL